ncbi:MAG: BlaB/IND/MUS family subclass B1 metallo-beta-lactamase [Sphingobacteriales bacterium]|uniref:BlaB/IND/MUS family subclass B1 metallo-beta-lactamase n=1 Tax=Hydrotalea flava TaxID=714549 RepID=UPI000830278F|nr:BlaB/IND/MUS family subclass B1 metallo-beta-lactamase [Hydrotalea flava]RTL48844.1 MAG: BlaB/IND/MUS family subclass B1 metallo-beta-lactamase [Sphingobacteriales bacterium]
MKTILQRGLITLLVCITLNPNYAQSTHLLLSFWHLKGNFYIFTTYGKVNGTPYPANGMYVVTERGVVLLDTPWDTTQLQPLLDSILQRHHQKVVLCIATHFHSDRTIGLNYYARKGIATYSSKATQYLCKQNHEGISRYVFTKDTLFKIGNYEFQTFYPGEGHSSDNIVIWFPNEKILYGRCFIKSTETNNLGNLSDANVQAWKISMQKTIQQFPKPAFVIPGHLDGYDAGSLQHTIQLLDAYGKNLHE